MKFCEICKKEESKWGEGFIFAYQIKYNNNQHYYCPECTLKRLKELADEKSDKE